MRYANIYEFYNDYPHIVLEVQRLIGEFDSINDYKKKVNKARSMFIRGYYSNQNNNDELLRVVNDFCNKLIDGNKGWTFNELMSIRGSDDVKDKGADNRRLIEFKDRLSDYYYKLAENRIYVDNNIIQDIYLKIMGIYSKVDNGYEVVDIANLINNLVSDVKKNYGIDLDSDKTFKEQLENVNNEKNNKEKYSYSYNRSNDNDKYIFKEELFQEIIIATMIKYYRGSKNLEKNFTSGYDYLRPFINDNSTFLIPNDEKFGKLRDKAEKFLNSDDIKKIVENSGVFGNDAYDTLYGIRVRIINYIDTVMLNYIIGCEEKRFPDAYLDSINSYIEEGRIDCITNSVGDARKVAVNLDGDRVKKLFKCHGVNDIYGFYDKVYKGDGLKKGRGL